LFPARPRAYAESDLIRDRSTVKVVELDADDQDAAGRERAVDSH
jgi:hypothetical protein